MWWPNKHIYVTRAITSCLRLNMRVVLNGLIKYDSDIALLINKHSGLKKAVEMHYLPIWI